MDLDFVTVELSSNLKEGHVKFQNISNHGTPDQPWKMRFMIVHCQVLMVNNEIDHGKDDHYYLDDHYGVFIAKKDVKKGTKSIELHESYLSFDHKVMKEAMYQLAQKLFRDEESCEVKCHHQYPEGKLRRKAQIPKGECSTMHREIDQPVGCTDY